MQFLFDPLLRLATAPWRWFVRRRRLALLLIPFGLAAGRADASDEGILWTPVSLKQADRTRYDLELTLRARRLLVEDAALARYDITVRIDDRVAELSGPVPSMAIALRAESNLKGLLGLVSVRNHLTIEDKSASTSEQAHVDWRVPQLYSQFTSSALAKNDLASRLNEVSAEPAFVWRPARSLGLAAAFPIPFVPEGLSRPTEARQLLRESSTGSRENLRIGKVDCIISPVEWRRELDEFVLPPIDLRHADEKTAPAAVDSANSNRLRYLFFGY
jgi:hypothetical protein